MTVYIDVLIFINMFVNFFILRLSAALCHERPRAGRLLLSSFIGALFSLYILLPLNDVFTQTAVKLVTSAVVVILAFPFAGFKPFLRRLAVFFAASFLYAGFMLAVWYLLKPNGMAVNNGVVYFNVSPLLLIGITLITYFVLMLLRTASQRRLPQVQACRLWITVGDKTVVANAVVDTGNTLTDCTDGAPVFILEKALAGRLLGFVPEILNFGQAENLPGFRLVPFSTVGGSGMMVGFKPDRVEAELLQKRYTVQGVTLAVSNERLGGEYDLVIGPDLPWEPLPSAKTKNLPKRSMKHETAQKHPSHHL